METYYQDITTKIEDAMQNERFQDAYDMLKIELSMPYVPNAFEDKMKQLQKTCFQALQPKRDRLFNDDEIAALLNGDNRSQFFAIEQMNKQNIRNFLGIIQTYFLSETADKMVKAFLCEALAKQKVVDEMSCYDEGLEIKFIPTFITLPFESEGVRVAIHQINDWFENDNPTFTLLCIQTLMHEAYLRLPFSIEESDGFGLAFAVANYVFQAYDETTPWNTFLVQNHLEKEKIETLKLRTYDEIMKT